MKRLLFVIFLVLVTPVKGMAAFVDNGDGTVTDTATGLMWQQLTDGGMNWESAITHCEALTLAGYDDWRLPNLTELESIVDYSRYHPAINTIYFPDTLSSDYWSSTTYANNLDHAWYVRFDYGIDGGYGDDDSYYKSHSYHVRAVRSGQSRLLDHLIISSPVQGSVWEVGDILPIRWDTASLGGDVEISLSRQGGKAGTFTTLVAGTGNDGVYDWTVTGTWSPNCVLKIVPTADAEKETSQGLFSAASLSHIYGTVHYVNGSDGTCGGKSPCSTTIQAAIDAAWSGAAILIAKGTYTGSIILNQSKLVTLKGGWDSSYSSQTSNSTFIKAPSAPKGSLKLQMVTVKP